MPRLLLLMVFLLCGLAEEPAYKLLYFEATWCTNCKPHSDNLKDKTVVAAMKEHKVKLVTIDFDEEPDAIAKYKIKSVPTTILVRITETGQAVVVRREAGILTPKQLVQLVQPEPPSKD